jgi:predicted NBD/HSP70 family sugar kinase
MTERGNPAAKRHVARQAADIGAIVASCVSVVDPGVVVLGGGLGSSPLLLPDVRETVSRLSYSVEIRSTLLGSNATVLGIEQSAIEHAIDRAIGRDAGRVTDGESGLLSKLIH